MTRAESEVGANAADEHCRVTTADWRLGWAAGFVAALSGKPSPNVGRSKGGARIVAVGTHRHFRDGYKRGYADTLLLTSDGRKQVKTEPNWDVKTGEAL